MNILIVEDDLKIAQAIKKTVNSTSKFNIIDIAVDYKKAINLFKTKNYDFFLVDFFLGETSKNGLEVCRFIRKSGVKSPIIIITSASDIDILEKSFSVGVDDYITKPFNTRELLARLSRFSLRNSNENIQNDELKYGGLSYISDLNVFKFKELDLALTKKQKALLLCFLKQPERVISKDVLSSVLWGDVSFPEKHNLRSNIGDLRNALPVDLRSAIKTQRGEGYYLEIS